MANIQSSIMGLFDVIYEERDGKDVVRSGRAGGTVSHRGGLFHL
jgi:hypothetical protein